MCLIQTDSVSSDVWIEKNRDIKFDLSIENYVSTLNMPGDSLEELELEKWDSLSDEALLNFEQNLE